MLPPETAGPAILVVDDTPVNLKLMRLLMTHEGYRVRTAERASEALRLLQEFRPDLVLTDIRLPGMDGLEMTRRIKADPRTREIRVVAVTACGGEEDRQEALRAGCEDYIAKPVDTATLASRIRGLLSQFPGRRIAPPELPQAASRPAVPEHLVQALRGSRIALVGFDPEHASRMKDLLEQVEAVGLVLDSSEHPDSELATSCGLAIVKVRKDTLAGPWLSTGATSRGRLRIVLAGRRVDVLAVPPEVRMLAAECLVEDGESIEMLMRLALARERPEPHLTPAPARMRVSRPRVVLADDDYVVLTIAGSTLENHGMACLRYDNGSDALQAIRDENPHIAVLDVNMPGLTGYEVLSAIRTEDLPTKVVMLSARRKESEIVRGFELGADDYMVKPFNPFELAARLKRLMREERGIHAANEA